MQGADFHISMIRRFHFWRDRVHDGADDAADNYEEKALRASNRSYTTPL